MKISSNGDYIVSAVGVEYSAAALEAYAPSSYNASKKYDGRVDTSWVIDNYLDGIHPTTDGSRIAGQAIYTEIIDAISPTQKMEEYLDEYGNVFANNVYSYLAAYVLNKR